MGRRYRIRQVAKRTGAILTILLVAAWGLSLRWRTGYHPKAGRQLVINDGWIFIAYLDDHACTGPGWFIDSARVSDRGTILPWVLRGSGDVVIPFWVFIIVTVVPTVFLFYRDRRRPRPGCCMACGYNLTGNTSGRCPECGAAVKGNSDAYT